jgi:soluble lytic murein transglycosylase
MSTTVRTRRASAQRSNRRGGRKSAARGGARRRSERRRRPLVIAGTLLVCALGGFLLVKSDFFQNTIEEFTLPLEHEDIIRQQAADKDVPADLIAAVIYSESRFRDQTSHAGARGLMQITPSTAKLIERLSGGQTFKFDDLSDPDINIRYGTFYLRYLLQKFDNNEVAALAAYNAGETNVIAWGGSDLQLDDIPFPETRGYVEAVLEKRKDYASHYRDELGLG